MKAPHGTDEFLPDLTRVDTAGSLPSNDIEIGDGEKPLVLSIEFPDMTLEPVSHHCVSDLATDGYPDSCRRSRRASVHYNKMRGMYRMPLRGKSQKIDA
jgi:hypothetical protein